MGTQSSKEDTFGSNVFSANEYKNLETVFFHIAGDGKRTFDEKQLQVCVLRYYYMAPSAV